MFEQKRRDYRWTIMLATFITGVAAPDQQLLNVFVTNFPEKSHLGQAAADHVVLRCDIGDLNILRCDRILSNGTLIEHFTIPSDKILVVTDIIWWGFQSENNETVPPGTDIHMELFAGQDIVLVDHTTVLASGGFKGSEHMTAGFAVSSTTTLRVFAASEFDSPRFFPYILLYGYLKTEQ